ncbi:MAG: AsmA family protein [Pseudomonadota bacterium]|nr:AsmA family protein [Pseudomonadota bacterium]
MAKPLKIFLIIFGVLFALLLAVAIAVPMFFDPNNFRQQISEIVQEGTGRSFEVGNIELQVFPWLHAEVTDVKLGNAEGFGSEPFAAVQEMGVGIQLIPLLRDKQAKISGITLDGLRLNLAVNKDGVNNWQDISAHREKLEREKPEEETKVEGEASFKIEDIDIDGIEISDAVLRYSDAKAGKTYAIEPLNLDVGSISPGEPFDIELSLTTLSESPKAALDLKLDANVTPDLDTQVITLKDPKISFKLKAQDPAITAEGDLSAQILADLKQGLFSIDALKLKATATGDSLPGGKQTVSMDGALRYDQKQGTMSFKDARIEAAGAVITTSIQGEGLNSEQPRLSGPVKIATFSPRDLFKLLGIEAPKTADDKVLTKAALSAQYSGSFKSAALRDLNLTLDDTTVTGQVGITDFATKAVELALKVDAINADRYLPPKSEPSEPAAEPGASADINAIKLPTEALDKLNADGTIDIGKLTINKLQLTDVRLKLGGKGDQAKTQEISAKLYGGNVNLSNRYAGGGTPAFALKTNLTALNAAPFLADFLGKDYVSGLGNINLDLTSRGTTVGDIRKALNGTLSFKVEQGAVKGFNLGQILRTGEALLHGQAVPKASNEPLETDFAALSASASIVNGILSTSDLAAASPAFRLAGSGSIDLVNETINFIAKPTVVETSKGQGGKDLEALKGLTIPIELSGNLFKPKYKLGLDQVVKDKAKDKLKEKIGEELGLPKGESSDQQIKEKINEKLGDLLFGKKKKGSAPADPATEPAAGAAPAAKAAEPTPTPAPAAPAAQ